MKPFLLVGVGWFIHLLVCFYIIRPIRHIQIRMILVFIPCIILTDIGTRNLPTHHIYSVFIIAIYWMISIRMIHLTVLSPNKFLTLPSYILTCLWILFPIIPCQSTERQ